MRKFLVISYYDGNIGIDVVKDTYEEAKGWMDNDVKDFISPIELEDVDESVCWHAINICKCRMTSKPTY